MTEPTPEPEPAGTALAQTPASPMQILAHVASDPDCDVAKLTAIVELQERMVANEAKAAHANAMAKFQAECPPIPKRARGDKANFAPFEDIMAVVQPLLTKHGLAVSFSSEPAAEGSLRIVCHITKGMHTEARGFTCPVPTMINPKTNLPMANEAQCMGMALSYAKRYCLGAAWNVVTAGEDFDGGPAPLPAAAADPDAVKAPTRGERTRMNDLYTRYKKAGGLEATWWPMVAKTIGGVKAEADITPDEWDKVAVVVGEMEEAT